LTRMRRLTPEERTEFDFLVRSLSDPATNDKDTLLARLGALASKTDTYDPIKEEPVAADSVDLQGKIFQGVWAEAAAMRRSGGLLDLAKQIQCPVVAIHGEYDPHPAAGVQESLSERLENFRFLLLKHCGHTPWIDRQARQEFYALLKSELG
jgi:pimeloyl-ACP methyl ester carboxylesterase